MAADGNDDIIGEPMVVHCLVRSLCRLAADRVEHPVDLVQVDIGRQRAEWTALLHPDLACGLDDLLHEMHDLGVLNALRNLIQQDRVSNRVKIF